MEEVRYMRLLVFADSHGKTAAMTEIAGAVSPDMILHLGDFGRDTDVFNGMYETKAVAGNCDGSSVEHKSELVFSVMNKKIFMLHGHTRGVDYNFGNLVYAAAERGADVALFGHTHIADVFVENDILFMNPGSITKPHDDFPGCGLIVIDNDGMVTASIIKIQENNTIKVVRQESTG
jgi:hypothetical protein